MFDEGQGVARAPDAIHPIVTGGAGYKMSYLPIWGGGSQTVMRKFGVGYPRNVEKQSRKSPRHLHFRFLTPVRNKRN